MKAIRIWWLKRQLRAEYQSYMAMLDSVGCGRHMASSLPSVMAAKSRCNATLQKLAELDPENCPVTSIG